MGGVGGEGCWKVGRSEDLRGEVGGGGAMGRDVGGGRSMGGKVGGGGKRKRKLDSS